MAAAASDQQQQPPPRSNRYGFEESGWVENIRQSLRRSKEDGDGIPVSVFDVPKQLQVHKPEAYAPQFIALGPYHHWRPELYEMEGYKIDAARRALTTLGRGGLDDLVSKLALHESKVRAHYHRYLDLGGETLSLMMLVDGAFLLEFLAIHHATPACVAERQTHRVLPLPVSSRMAHLADVGGTGRKSSAHGLILRDLLMLENQIPLLVLREILDAQQSVHESEPTTRLNAMVTGLIKEVCPLKMKGNFPFPDKEIDVANHAHLLELLYHLLVPKPSAKAGHLEVEVEEQPPDGDGHVDEDIEEQRPDGGGQEKESKYVMQLLAVMWRIASRLKSGRLRHVLKPMVFAAKAPWKMLTGISASKVNMLMPADGDGSEASEITIPSVSELVSSGIQLAPTNGMLSTIAFNGKTRTLHLPAVTLDCNTEVVLRNLVAYESSAASGPLALTRYTELMNGIVDTGEDVALLRKRGVLLNRMKSDEEAARMWNGMSRSVHHSRVPELDAVIEDVNRYYDGRWRVKAKRCMRKYVLSSWKMLTFLATLSMLLLTTLQAFCSVYACSRWVTDTVATVTPAD
ncbi:putative UPF0481 protein [Hordeum vulgare]|nr:putative UPF0481 protein [Hordeum vulgare]